MSIAENPFYVLGVAPDASRIEIEREAQKLLGMLELDFAEVRTYATPVGPRPRLVAELWARHAPPSTSEAAPATAVTPTTTSGLRRGLGWGP